MALGLWRIAEEDPARTAIVDARGATISFGELAERSNRLVHGLRSLGLGPGDAVAGVLENEPAILELAMAALQGGLYFTPINYHLTAREISYILEDSGARALVCSPVHAAVCHEAVAPLDPRPACLATGPAEGFGPYHELVADVPPSRPDGRTAGATMHYTSGTTGRPKGVRRRLSGADPDEVAVRFTGLLAFFGIPPHRGVHLVVSPLYHTGVMVFACNSLHHGHGLVLMERWTPEEMLRLVERHRVTTTHMVPTQFHRLLTLPEAARRQADLRSLTHVIHSAAPCPPQVKRRMLEWLGPVIVEYYAATEGGGTLVTAEEWLARPGTVGRAWPGARVQVLDDEGQTCPPGVAGTVWMSLAQSDFTYHRDDEKTRAGRRGGFFTVGDVGHLDEEGYLFLRDRSADMIISGGVNIYPAETEAVLFTSPAVADCAVFGVPDPEWGEQVKAVVEPAPGAAAGPELERELIEFCRERLAAYKCPRTVEFAAALPRDPNGKLAKRKLRDPYWAGRDRAI